MRGMRSECTAIPSESPAKAGVYLDTDLMSDIKGSIKHLAVAVSGGADSMALALLLHDWCRHRGISLTALTVDHGLRPNSSDDAVFVEKILRRLGIPVHILTWQCTTKVTGNIQAMARQARYQLLTDWCHAHDVNVLCTGHHQNDLIETFVMRLQRGSGVQGLAAMRPESYIHGIKVLRPLLKVEHKELCAWLRTNDMPWREDPSNQNTDFTRVKVRQGLQQWTHTGLDQNRLLLAANNLRRADDALQAAVIHHLSATCHFFTSYIISIDQTIVNNSEEIIFRSLSILLQQVGGREHPPRLETVQRVARRLQQGKPCTAHGCMFVKKMAGYVLCREPRDVAAPVLLTPGRNVWDGRVVVRVDQARLTLGALGAIDAAAFKKHKVLWPALQKIPHPARLTLPTLRKHAKILAILGAGIPDLHLQDCDYTLDVRYICRHRALIPLLQNIEIERWG